MTALKNSIKLSRLQRILPWVVLCGIFVCGVMAGAFIWESKTRYTAKSGVYEKSGIRTFVENRLKYHKMCEEIEEVLLKRIVDSDYEHNFKIYKELVDKGCDENKQQFAELAAREQARYNAIMNLSIIAPCKEIENTLIHRISDCTSYMGNIYQCHSQNAEKYAKLAKSGCVENVAFYKAKALSELKVLEGLRDDNEIVSEDEAWDVVNIYKKLQMQNEARKYIKKMEKLVDPGVEFIMELQRVIEE